MNMLKNCYVIDYSYFNTTITKNDKHLFIPYQIIDKEINMLKNMLTCEKIYDVAICGGKTFKRKNIVNILNELGLKVVFIHNIFGIERDKLIAQSKILLNVHAHDNYIVYESLRCDRWIFSGMLVVSESCIDIDTIDVRDLILTENYDKLHLFVQNVLHNYDHYYNLYINNLNKYSNNIIADRKHKLLQLKQFIDD